LAAGSAVAKLREAGFGPASSTETSTAFKVGWREFTSSGRKQYEMYLSLNRSVRTIPDRHAIAYARAKDEVNFRQIIRQEVDVADPLTVRDNTPRKRSSTKKGATTRRKGAATKRIR
jgi:hypothetical protein